LQNRKLNKEIAYANAIANGHGLKWHGFLIYFVIWMNALYCFTYNVMPLLDGTVWGEYYELIKQYKPDLFISGILIGVAYLILVVGLVRTRFALAQFKKNAPKKLTRCYIISIVLPATFWLYSSVSISEFIPMPWIISALGTCFGAFINHIYYKKRSYLFVN